MPNSKVHYKLWKIGWADAVCSATAFAYYYPLVSAGILVGYAFGKIDDPDLDLVGISGAEGRALRSLGPLGVVWVMYWFPYGTLFKHRSFWTHSYVFSTAIRFVYLFWWVYWLIFKNGWYDWWTLLVSFGVFVGLVISDSIHILADRRIKSNE